MILAARAMRRLIASDFAMIPISAQEAPGDRRAKGQREDTHHRDRQQGHADLTARPAESTRRWATGRGGARAPR